MPNNELKNKIIDWIKSCYVKKGREAIPSVREIMKGFKLSRRRFYKLFPDGLTGICKNLGIELPERFKRTEKLRTVPKEEIVDELGAKIFEEFGKGRRPERIVVKHKISPDVVLAYYEKWLKLRGVPNPNSIARVEELAKRLKELDEIICEKLVWKNNIPISNLFKFECECGAKGKVAVHIKCTACGEETWWGWWPKE